MKKKNEIKERNMDLAEHDYRIKSIGIPHRVRKIIIRAVVIALPVLALLYWFMKQGS
jgi:hypothetical protein